MTKSSKDYWTEREDEHRQKLVRDEKRLSSSVNDIYARMIREANSQIESWYQKYADKEGITIADAKKRVSRLDINEYAAKAKEYVANKDLSEQANQEMRLYNLTMKVNRLEILKSQIGMQMAGGFSDIEKIIGRGLRQEARNEMTRQAGILGHTVQHNERAAETIAQGSFWNASFSDRLWQHQDMLKHEIDRELQRGLILGKNPKVLARDISRVFGASQNNAERLMITEMCRAQTEAQKASYERNGYDEYIYIACGGSDCCEECAELDGQVFKVSDMQPGVNAPPMHPYCHCSTAAHMSEDDFQKWFDAEESSEPQEHETGGHHYDSGEYDTARSEAASQAYEKYSREDDAQRIAKNSGFSIADIREIKRHIFHDKHELYDGYGRFSPDYDMAAAWKRLREGDPLPRDITLLNHELLESRLEKQYNLSAAKAHTIANEKYDWWAQVVEEIGEEGEPDGLL